MRVRPETGGFNRLDARPEHVSALPQSSDCSGGAVANAAIRIALVEDDETLALLITYNLQAKGYYVDWLPRGDTVDAYISNNVVGLFIIDWILPGRSGLDICRSIRRRADLSRTPIIMASALGHKDDRSVGLAAGADCYLAKPFSMATLIASVDWMLRRTRPHAE